MVIDIHTHTFPDELAARALALLSERAGEAPFTDCTNEGLRASMRAAGIDCSVIMPIATKPTQVRSINAWAAGVNRQYDDLLAFGTLHPAQEDWAREINRLAADGIPGVKLHPDYQEFFVDEERMLPIYRALAEAGLAALLHAGADIGLPPPVHCEPDRLARVLDMAPGLTIIAAHMGANEQWDEAEEHLIGRELYLDTSYSLPYLGPERMTALIRAHGVARVLFATDSPWADQTAELAGMRALPLTAEEREAVLGGNAERLLAGHLARCPA